MKPEDIVGDMDDNLEILLEMGVIELDAKFIKKTLESGSAEAYSRLKGIISRTGNDNLKHTLLKTLLKMGDNYAKEGLQYMKEFTTIPDDTIKYAISKAFAHASPEDDLELMLDIIALAERMDGDVFNQSEHRSLGIGYYKLGIFEEDAERFDSAIAHLEKGKHKREEYANSLLIRGLQKKSGDQFKAGMKAYRLKKMDLEQTVELVEKFNPTDSFRECMRTGLLAMPKLPEKALGHLKKAVEYATLPELNKLMGLVLESYDYSPKVASEVLVNLGKKIVETDGSLRMDVLKRYIPIEDKGTTELAKTLIVSLTEDGNVKELLDLVISDERYHSEIPLLTGKLSGDYLETAAYAKKLIPLHKETAESLYRKALTMPASSNDHLQDGKVLIENGWMELGADYLDKSYSQAKKKGKRAIFDYTKIVASQSDRLEQLLEKAANDLFAGAEKKEIVDGLFEAETERARELALGLVDNLSTSDSFEDLVCYGEMLLGRDAKEKGIECYQRALSRPATFEQLLAAAKRLEDKDLGLKYMEKVRQIVSDDEETDQLLKALGEWIGSDHYDKEKVRSMLVEVGKDVLRNTDEPNRHNTLALFWDKDKEAAQTIALDVLKPKDDSFESIVDCADELSYWGLDKEARRLCASVVSQDSTFAELYRVAESQGIGPDKGAALAFLEQAYQTAEGEEIDQVLKLATSWKTPKGDHQEIIETQVTRITDENFDPNLCQQIACDYESHVLEAIAEGVIENVKGKSYKEIFTTAHKIGGYLMQRKQAYAAFDMALEASGGYKNHLQVAWEVDKYDSKTAADYFNRALKQKAPLKEYQKTADKLMEAGKYDLAADYYTRSFGKRKDTKKCSKIGSDFVEVGEPELAKRFFDQASHKADGFESFIDTYEPMLNVDEEAVAQKRCKRAADKADSFEDFIGSFGDLLNED